MRVLGYLLTVAVVVTLIGHAVVLHCILQRLRMLDERVVRLIRGAGLFHTQVTMLLRRLIGDMLSPPEGPDPSDDTEVR